MHRRVSTSEMLKLYEVEEVEVKYLDFIAKIFAENLDFMRDRFLLRLKVYKSWKDKLKREIKRTTDMGIGAERIMHYIIARYYGEYFSPVSIPVGSNLFYETEDAFVHIDLKTAYVQNGIDYMGLVVVGDAQTSYPMKNKWGALREFEPKLPVFYDIGKGKRKLCLTYAILIIHVDIEEIIEEKLDPNMLSVVIASIPNGLLYNIYGDEICWEPKSFHYKKNKKLQPANFRYIYYKKPLFETLKSRGIKQYRIKLFFNKNYSGIYFDIQTSKYGGWKKVKISPRFITQISSKKILSKITTYI